MLRGKIRMDDSYHGGELPGGTPGRGLENMIPIVAAVSLNEAAHPIHVRITDVTGLSSKANSDWAKGHLRPGSQVLFDGLACFLAVTSATMTCLTSAGSTLYLASPRTAYTALFMPSTTGERACDYDKYARRYLGGLCLRFNGRFSMV